MFDTIQYPGDRVIHIIDALKCRIIQRIQTNGQSFESRFSEINCPTWAQHRAIRSQTDIVHLIHRVYHFDEMFEVAADQWLTPGNPDFTHPDRSEDPCNPSNFFKR